MRGGGPHRGARAGHAGAHAGQPVADHRGEVARAVAQVHPVQGRAAVPAPGPDRQPKARPGPGTEQGEGVQGEAPAAGEGLPGGELQRVVVPVQDLRRRPGDHPQDALHPGRAHHGAAAGAVQDPVGHPRVPRQRTYTGVPLTPGRHRPVCVRCCTRASRTPWWTPRRPPSRPRSRERDAAAAGRGGAVHAVRLAPAQNLWPGRGRAEGAQAHPGGVCPGGGLRGGGRGRHAPGGARGEGDRDLRLQRGVRVRHPRAHRGEQAAHQVQQAEELGDLLRAPRRPEPRAGGRREDGLGAAGHQRVPGVLAGLAGQDAAAGRGPVPHHAQAAAAPGGAGRAAAVQDLRHRVRGDPAAGAEAPAVPRRDGDQALPRQLAQEARAAQDAPQHRRAPVVLGGPRP
ncbi:unnamed protein product [Heterosigma akashiwo]